jgi:hypothetical protein
MGRVTDRFFLSLALVCLACSTAAAGGVSERSGHVNDVGLMTLSNQTQLFTAPELAFYVSPQFQWGVTDDLELLAIVGAKFGSKLETDPGLLALRYEILDGFSLGLGGTFPVQDDGTLFGVYPGLYATFNLAEELTLTMNVAFNLTAIDVEKSWIWHTSVVEWVFNSEWSAYLEVDWVIPIEKAVADSDLNLFVGGQYNINTTHALNLFVMMPLIPSVAPESLSVGLTWALAWNL